LDKDNCKGSFNDSYNEYDTLYLEIKATDLMSVFETKIVTDEDLKNERMVVTYVLRGEFRGPDEIYPGDKGEGL